MFTFRLDTLVWLSGLRYKINRIEWDYFDDLGLDVASSVRSAMPG